MRSNIEVMQDVSATHDQVGRAGLQLPSPVRSMRVDQVSAETRALRRTSRVGPWADPFPAIHGGPDTAD